MIQMKIWNNMNKDYIWIGIGYIVAIVDGIYSNNRNSHFLIYTSGILLSLVFVYHIGTIEYNKIIKKRVDNDNTENCK